MKTLPTSVRDALYNLHISSGATDDYRRGILVGVVSTLVGMGIDFKVAITSIREWAKFQGIIEFENYAPESWRYCEPT